MVWLNNFVEQNGLQIDTVKHDWKKWTELPEWFRTDHRFLVCTKHQNNKFEGSQYFINTENRNLFHLRDFRDLMTSI
jgi:hypothetical protein